MAFKKYAYYNKGNKVALVEAEMSSSGGNLAVAHCTLSGYTTKDTCEAAGGQWIPSSSSSSGSFEKYISPKESVTGGLEIQYSYVPTFNLQSTGTEGTDFHKFLGWGSDGINLLLFTWGQNLSSTKNISSYFSADDWIYIKGSGRWSGLHQVKSTGGTTGILTLKTKCNIPAAKLSVQVNFATDETAVGSDQEAESTIESYQEQTETRSTKYVFIDQIDNSNNGGLMVVKDSSTDGKLSFTKKVYIDNNRDYVETSPTFAESDDDTVVMYNAFYEQINVYEGVDVLEDEDFELDLTEYQAQAVVYYVKAKLAEDLSDFERREFFMRLFKKQIEKASSARKRGPYIVQGFSGMR